MMMKLYYNPPSPYARKVLVTAHEKDLLGRIELRAIDPWPSPHELLAATPLGKVPALVTDEGMLLTESMLIAEYLDAIGPGRKLTSGDRHRIMARVGLAQGLMDAAFGVVIERRRPAEWHWPAWEERQRGAIERTLPRLEVSGGGDIDHGDISLACALAYLDFRLPEIGWREARPDLAGWLDGVNQRPSMQSTRS